MRKKLRNRPAMLQGSLTNAINLRKNLPVGNPETAPASKSDATRRSSVSAREADGSGPELNGRCRAAARRSNNRRRALIDGGDVTGFHRRPPPTPAALAEPAFIRRWPSPPVPIQLNPIESNLIQLPSPRAVSISLHRFTG